MQLSSDEQHEVNGVAQTLRQRFGATDVRLYGSAARGTMTSGSDIDLLAVLPRVDWGIEKQISDLCFEAEQRIGRIISVNILSRTEYEDSPLRHSPLILAVQHEGRAL